MIFRESARIVMASFFPLMALSKNNWAVESIATNQTDATGPDEAQTLAPKLNRDCHSVSL